MGIAGGFESIVETKDGLGLIFDTGIQESDLNVGLERAIGLGRFYALVFLAWRVLKIKRFIFAFM